MKTSNKLLLAATLILFAYLAVYDVQLKAEYLKGDYKSRFYNMDRTTLTAFSSIQNNAGNSISIAIEKGPGFEVWVNKYLKDKLTISEHNGTLIIDSKDKDLRYYQGVTIICPSVKTVIATPLKTTWQFSATTQVTGFTQDEMTILANKNTKIELSKNSIGKLYAGTGASNATISINSDNDIKAADFKITGKSELKLFNPIVNSTYRYTDSATITLNGKAFAKFQH